MPTCRHTCATLATNSREHAAALALGGAAMGQMETILGPYSIGLQPVRKRAATATSFIDAISAFVDRRTTPLAAHTAWILATRSCIHAFDYDARLVGAAALQPVVQPVYDKILALASRLAEGVDALAVAQLSLPGAFGGCSMRMTALAPHAHAARWAAHDANTSALMDLCAALGTPFVRHDPDIVDAIAGLLHAGIIVRPCVPATLVPEAADAYDATPWRHDQSACARAPQRPLPCA
jgi:hypothetical protein